MIQPTLRGHVIDFSEQQHNFLQTGQPFLKQSFPCSSIILSIHFIQNTWGHRSQYMYFLLILPHL